MTLKKTLITIIGFLITTTNCIAADYKIFIDNKHYKNKIIITKSNEDTPPILVNPYNIGEFVSIDYKNENDNLVTLDATTGLEWLDISETTGLIYSEFEAGNISGFDGWRLPTESEVNDMIERFAEVDFDVSIVVSNSIYNKFFSLYGITAQSEVTSWQSGAWVKKENGEINVAGVSKNRVMYNTSLSNPTNTALSITGYAHFGIWLVSEGGVSITSISQPEINVPATN